MKVKTTTPVGATITFDFSGSEGIQIDGSSNLVKKVEVGGNGEESFSVTREAPFKQTFTFEYTLSVGEQAEFIADLVDKSSRRLAEAIDLAEDEFAQLPVEVMPVDEIIKAVKDSALDHFIDLDFPPCAASIYDTNRLETCPLVWQDGGEINVKWRRAAEIWPESTVSIFKNGIDPNDVHQGQLANSWFLSAVAAVSENPKLIERLFITKEVNDEGVYKIRINKCGKWQVVTVDDYVPCLPGGGPIFAKGNGSELWVILLEKAYAKIHGNYMTLEGGSTVQALRDLTGCPTISTLTEEYAEEPEDAFELLKELDGSGALLLGGKPDFDSSEEVNERAHQEGLNEGHAYSIIKVEHFEDEDIKLLQIRNPFGKAGENEWDGDWHNGCPKWEEVDGAVDFFNPTLDSDDGTFWISFDDFITQFKELGICYVGEWNEVRLAGKFISVKEKDSERSWVVSKNSYTFTLNEDAKVHVGVHQEDERNYGAAEARPYLDIGFALLKQEEGSIEFELQGHAETIQVRDNQKEFELEAGKYVVVPRTVGGYMSPNEDAEETDWGALTLEDRIGVETFNPFFRGLVYDIFTKTDVGGNRTLDAAELNLLGEISGIAGLRDVTDSDFSEGGNLWKYNCDESGLTKTGLLQFVHDQINELSPEEQADFMSKLGYNPEAGNFSYKSRAITITILSDQDVSA